LQPDLLKQLSGFYVLTSAGELGAYDSDGTFHVDAVLTKRFLAFNTEFLKYYLSHLGSADIRLGIVFQSVLEKSWNSPTLLLETETLMRLYPMSGARDGELTGFQKRNREKSVFRGVELFLDYRNEEAPEVPIYVPVLFYRNTNLKDYSSFVNKGEYENQEAVPVIEVLNLVGVLPQSKKESSIVIELEKAIYKSVVRKDARKTPDLGFARDVVKTSDAGPSSDAYSNIDKRAERELGYDFNKIRMNDDDPHNIHQWMLTPVEYVKGDVLRFFTQFQDVEIQVLNVIAGKSPKYAASTGTILLRQGKTDKWSFFLLEGELELQAADGEKKTVCAGANNSRSAISYLKPRMYTVRALTPVKFLWIHDKLIEAAMKLKAKSEEKNGLSILK